MTRIMSAPASTSTSSSCPRSKPALLSHRPERRMSGIRSPARHLPQTVSIRWPRRRASFLRRRFRSRQASVSIASATSLGRGTASTAALPCRASYSSRALRPSSVTRYPHGWLRSWVSSGGVVESLPILHTEQVLLVWNRAWRSCCSVTPAYSSRLICRGPQLEPSSRCLYTSASFGYACLPYRISASRSTLLRQGSAVLPPLLPAMLSSGARTTGDRAAQPTRSTGRREPEAARRARGVSRAVGCIREERQGGGAGELQGVGRRGRHRGRFNTHEKHRASRASVGSSVRVGQTGRPP